MSFNNTGSKNSSFIKMKKSTLYSCLVAMCLSGFFVSCKDPVPVEEPVVEKKITILPEREVKVYFGASGNWHEQDDPENYSKWEYVRSNADGYYTNFISMWVCYYQNPVNPQTSCNDMRKAFKKGGVFFETSMETSVNSGANGFNNDSTDRRSINLLTNAGFTVDYTSLNYGVSVERIKLLRTYKATRKCLCLAAPWRYGGDILSNNTTLNASSRANILLTDGMQTDGPLGYWVNNQTGMREGNYSLVKYVKKYDLESAIMLAPYKAGVAGYEAENDFLKVSKQCVFDHEDNNATPDLWTIWTYQSPAALALYPESAINEAGEEYAPNTKAGVAYWLLKHLKTFPKISCKETGKVNNDVNVNLANDSVVNVKLTKNVEYSMPVIISNGNQPQIELSPVIRAIIDEAGKDWTISFWLGSKDVTDKIVYNGGLNCIEGLRLTKTNPLTLSVRIKSRATVANPSPVILNLQSMANISNTKQKKDFKITFSTL